MSIGSGLSLELRGHIDAQPFLDTETQHTIIDAV
jgi:hypothetical protein